MATIVSFAQELAAWNNKPNKWAYAPNNSSVYDLEFTVQMTVHGGPFGLPEKGFTFSGVDNGTTSPFLNKPDSYLFIAAGKATYGNHIPLVGSGHDARLVWHSGPDGGAGSILIDLGTQNVQYPFDQVKLNTTGSTPYLEATGKLEQHYTTKFEIRIIKKTFTWPGLIIPQLPPDFNVPADEPGAPSIPHPHPVAL